MVRPDTKDLLFNSLNELLQTRPLCRITIDEIAANCGFRRGTFYYYFKDKEDLIQTMVYKSVADNHNLYFGKGPWFNVLEHCLIFSDKYRLLLREVNNNYQWFYGDLLTYTEQYIERIVAEYLKKHQQKFTPDIKAAVSFYAAGSIRLYQQWLSSTSPVAAKEMALRIASCVPLCLKEALDGGSISLSMVQNG